MSQWFLASYACPTCGPFESLELRALVPDALSCPNCGAVSPVEECAGFMVRDKTRAVQAATTGKSDPRPPGMLDTRRLAFEGDTNQEWHKKLDKQDREKRLQQIKKDYGSW